VAYPLAVGPGHSDPALQCVVTMGDIDLIERSCQAARALGVDFDTLSPITSMRRRHPS
jgi:hypothetical protein